jgi:hypothetical protein
MDHQHHQATTKGFEHTIVSTTAWLFAASVQCFIGRVARASITMI